MSVVNVSVKHIRPAYKNVQEWITEDNHVYIGRACHYVGVSASAWANPYSVKKYGREEALRLYKTYVQENLIDRLEELRDKTLGCWCSPEKCHGDVLLELLSNHTE